MKKVLQTMIVGALTTNSFAVTIDQYLDQVRKQNMSYQAADKQDKGAALQKRESDLFFTPQFFFNAQSGFNAQLPSPPFMEYDEVRQQNLTAGISQEFSFGLEAKFSYSVVRHQYKGMVMNGNPMDDPYWEAVPSLELNVPLWGNAFGRTSKARQELTLFQRTAEQFGAKAQAVGTLVEAEIAYWRLAAAQESVQIQKKALDAARSILSYVTEKKKKNLGEEADVLQARALTDAYMLQLEQAETEERIARRKYNLHLNLDAETPAGELTSLDYRSLLKETVPETRPGDRPDVKASEAQVSLARASSALAVEQNKPTLNLIGGYSLFGRGDTQKDALAQAG